MAEVLQAAMKPYGYDVQICYNCNAADAPRIVSEARTPPPYKPDLAVPEILRREMRRDWDRSDSRCSCHWDSCWPRPANPLGLIEFTVFGKPEMHSSHPHTRGFSASACRLLSDSFSKVYFRDDAAKM